jgi:hypothetical protein
MKHMTNKPLYIRPEDARQYLYAKMHEAGHTPGSLAALFGVTRSTISQVLTGRIQPTKAMREMLGMKEVYLAGPYEPLPPGPFYEEVRAQRAMLAASGPATKKAPGKKTKKSPAKKKAAKPKERK